MQTPHTPPDFSAQTPWCPPDPSGEFLSALRVACGLSQTEAGALLGRSLRIWQDWEAGKRNAPAALISLFVIRTAALGLLPARHPGAAAYLPPELAHLLKSPAGRRTPSPRRLVATTGPEAARRIAQRLLKARSAPSSL